MTPAEALVDRFWRHTEGPGHVVGQPKGRWPTEVHPSVTAAARVNHGRWSVWCPFGCMSSQYASFTDRRMFCIECDGHQGRWVMVVWPDDLTVAAIEAALMLRPKESDRNWEPGETVRDLLEENQRMGVG